MSDRSVQEQTALALDPASRQRFERDVLWQREHYAESFWALGGSGLGLGSSSLVDEYLAWFRRNAKIHRAGRLEEIVECDFHDKYGWRLGGEQGSSAYLGKLAFSGEAQLRVGHGTYFAGACTILGDGHLFIGSWSCIGPKTVISTSPIDHHQDRLSFLDFFNSGNGRLASFGIGDLAASDSGAADSASRTSIGSDVWVGRECFIRCGANVGDGSAVGLRSNVTKPVAPFTIVAGNPIRLLRRRYTPEIQARVESLRWWDWSDERLIANAHLFRHSVTLADPATLTDRWSAP